MAAGLISKLQEPPIIATNLAKHQPSNSSWSDDMNIMDFANDDDFTTSWQSNPEVKDPWYEIDFHTPQTFNAIAIFENKANIKKYRLEYFANNKWNLLLEAETPERIKLHRFSGIKGEKVRIQIQSFNTPPSIAEFGIYNEPR